MVVTVANFPVLARFPVGDVTINSVNSLVSLLAL